jgi:3-hydroxybutyrate dehydrogenase
VLRDHTAVITGATSGIGLGLAEAFAAAGCRVAINGIATVQEADALVARLQQHGTEVFYHPADLSDPKQCAALIAAAQHRFGTIDILINNAGVQYVAPIEEFPPDRWDAILAINLSAAFHTIRAALPAMQNRNWGRIINMASVHGSYRVDSQGGVRSGQAWHRGADEGSRIGKCNARNYVQRDMPGLCSDAADRAPD